MPRLPQMWTKDHTAVDFVSGYDDPSRLRTDERHPVLMKTFSIPITKYPQPAAPNVYHTPLNDRNGMCHSMLVQKYSPWSARRVKFNPPTHRYVLRRHIDTADEGFLGTVAVLVPRVLIPHRRHTISDGGVLLTTVHATATEKTPIMLTQHIYWSAEPHGFEYGSDDILGHELYIRGGAHHTHPGGRDQAGTHFDYREARWIGAALEADPHNACIYSDGSGGGHTALWSLLSGLRLDITTDQPAVQVYTASLNMPRKGVHGGSGKECGERSTVAIEQEGWLDAISTPEWGVDQIYDRGREFRWNTKYRFSGMS
ncbi:galactose mutarotase-like protein [Mycena belliarum]|uniref:Galactose mutarotase-like protein n=1 Tax=Mycena belliarum TaxID=1033014 RepID=A0AAD6UIB6_9AGAR|nr:galactose mutarotase-like protein [Mycena belliae]